MSDYNSVNDEIKAQSEKVKKMSFAKRLSYYWHYDKWIMIAVVAVILLIIFIVRSTVLKKDAYVTGVFMNSFAPTTSGVELENAFAEYDRVNTKRYTVDFDYSLSYNIDDPTDAVSIYAPTKMIAYSEGRSGDFFLCDARTFDFFAKNGFFADLSEILTQEQLARYQDCFYYYDAEDGRGSIPVAILLENADLLHSMSCYDGMDEIYFSVFYYSEHKDRALTFLEFLSTEAD